MWKFYLGQLTSEWFYIKSGSESWGDKVLWQKGNSPNTKLKSLNYG